MKVKIIERTWELAEPVTKELGLILWDVKYLKEGASWYLRIFIDKDGGVFINDCEDVARLMNDILDEADFISDSYYFEVSSPGLGRELVRPEHFTRFIGEEVSVKLYKAQDGTKEISGILKSKTDENIEIEFGGESLVLEMQNVAKVKLLDDRF